jgi:hypothetical protein
VKEEQRPGENYTKLSDWGGNLIVVKMLEYNTSIDRVTRISLNSLFFKCYPTTCMIKGNIYLICLPHFSLYQSN